MQERLVNSLKIVNQQTLNPPSFTTLLQEKLVIYPNTAKSIEERSISLSLVNPSSLSHHEVELRLDQDLKNLRL